MLPLWCFDSGILQGVMTSFSIFDMQWEKMHGSLKACLLFALSEHRCSLKTTALLPFQV